MPWLRRGLFSSGADRASGLRFCGLRSRSHTCSLGLGLHIHVFMELTGRRMEKKDDKERNCAVTGADTLSQVPRESPACDRRQAPFPSLWPLSHRKDASPLHRVPTWPWHPAGKVLPRGPRRLPRPGSSVQSGPESRSTGRVELCWFCLPSTSTGGGNGNPPRCSSLENPRDGSPVGCTESDTTEAT